MLSEISHDSHRFLGESAEDSLAPAGVERPPAVTPFDAYLPAVQRGNLSFMSCDLGRHFPRVTHLPCQPCLEMIAR
jgi:hypothetical protein